MPVHKVDPRFTSIGDPAPRDKLPADFAATLARVESRHRAALRQPVENWQLDDLARKERSKELEALVASSWKEATTFGTMNEGPRLNADLMFEDVFKEMPANLRRQLAQMRAERGVERS